MVGIHRPPWRSAGAAFLMSIVGAAAGCGDTTPIGERCGLAVEHEVAANDVCKDYVIQPAGGTRTMPAACDADNAANACCNLAGRRGVYANCPGVEL